MLEQGHIGVWVPEELFSIAPRKIGMSHWLPSIVHRIPWQKLGIRLAALERYRAAEFIIRRKHHLPEKLKAPNISF
jgi:hypothetical protein